MPLLQLRQANVKRDNNELLVDIVAVHGLDENLTEAWSDPETKILWLRDLLPEQFNTARVLTFGYNADSKSFYGHRSADRIQQHAQTLVADLQADRALENCPQRPIIFICHGLGGILVKKALAYSSTRTSQHIEHLYSVFASTYAILFFGTPHQGTDKENWLAIAHAESPRQQAPPRFDTQLLMATEKGSETLQSITEQFAPLMKQFQIFFFWEELESGEGNRRGYIVEESSAAPLVDNTERSGIHANHFEMVRFSDRNMSSYRTVVEALGRYCRNAPAIISRRWVKAIETLARARSDEAFELAGVAFDVHNDNQTFQYQQKHSARPLNKHFHIPQAVSSVFTGREDISRIVEDSLFTRDITQPFRQQRRFIIHGIGGSGKSQFCSKFAQDHRERFWGVFWIDATSLETARQSFSKIGKQGGMEATLDAGKYWLSNCEEPWLLIINNADDPALDLTNLFPEGDRGHILVTTRNPNLIVHGTVGAIELKGLEPRDASLLLLKAAVTPKPWNKAIEDVADKVADALGYLALALVQAGAVILQGMCSLQDYLKFYNHFRSGVSERRSSGASFNADQVTIYATWEHSLSSLEQRATEAGEDASQLLSTVAFFHFEHIRVDIFARALENRSGLSEDATRPSLLMRLTGGIFARLQPPLVLPRFLRQNSWELDPHRIRLGLSELRSFSLINYDGKDDSFSLHPVVHSWARDRLENGAKAVWAQVAINVLADSILLPPDNAGESHEEFRRDILAHLDHCIRARSIEVLDYDSWFGGMKLPFALILHHSWLHVFRQQVITAAKCGYVYLERGRFNEAVALLSKTKDALIQSRGHNNSLTMAAMLALAKAYWGLGRLEEGLALQTTVVDARTKILGQKDADTLSAMNELGRSFWLNGQYHEALELQNTTLKLIESALGPTHDSTLTAMDNIGVTYGSWQRYGESRDMHHRVLTVRMKTLGRTHLHTLETMNNLAMALMDLSQLQQACELMDEVYKHRKTKLGKEHPYALWALCNLAKVKSKMQLLTEAEDMLVGGIAAAKRSLGENHLGVLMGEGELARVYARQGRLDKSLHLSERLIQLLEDSRGPGHPDTVYALFKLAQLYELRSEVDKAIQTSALAAERSEVRLTKRHPMAQAIYAQLNRLETQQYEHSNATAVDCDSDAKRMNKMPSKWSPTKDLWRSIADSKKQQLFGIKELYSPRASAEIDIVAVHGLNGDALTTWTSDKGNICWLTHPDLLPRYMPNARILTWGYNANVTSLKGRSTSSDRVLQHAQTLVADLQADRALEGAESRPIIFLCHSLGGIVVKRALAYSTSRTSSKIAHLHSIYTCTYGILFFGTPHLGSRKAHLLSSLQKLASVSLPKKALETDSSLLRALEEDSEVLQNLNDQFAPLMPRFCVFFFWEQERTDLKYTRDYIVDESSAAPVLDGTERAGIAADHRNMCKFEGKDAPGFRTVVAALKRYAMDAPGVVRERNRVAGQELGVKGWCEARELVRGIAGWEDLPRIAAGGGGDQGERSRHEVATLGEGIGDGDEVGVVEGR